MDDYIAKLKEHFTEFCKEKGITGKIATLHGLYETLKDCVERRCIFGASKLVDFFKQEKFLDSEEYRIAPFSMENIFFLSSNAFLAYNRLEDKITKSNH